MASCASMPRTYTVVSETDEDTRVYLISGTPNVLLDTLSYDDDYGLYLGKGSFSKPISVIGNIHYKSYFLVLEKAGYKPEIYGASGLVGKSNQINVGNSEGMVKKKSLNFPIKLKMNDVEMDYSGIPNMNTEKAYLSKYYHSSYSYGEEEDLTGQQEESVMQYITDLIVGMKNKDANDSIELPAFFLDVDITFRNESSYYYNNTYINIDLKLLDHQKNEIESSSTEQNARDVTFADFISEQIIELLNKTDFEEVAANYYNNIEVDQINWKTIEIPITKKKPIKISDCVVTVQEEESHGSGVMISSDGFVLTNHHVAGNLTKTTIVLANGEEYNANVIRTNPLYDITLLKVIDGDFDFNFENIIQVTQDSNMIDVGGIVSCIGSPLDPKLNGTISKGIVTGISENRGIKHYVVSASINPGNSGGALVNKKGRLIAIVNAKMTGYQVKNIGFAIPLKDVQDQLNIKFVKDEK
jgi:S1-C subfamily serine protease